MARISQQGGPKTTRRGRIFSIQDWMYVATGDQTSNGGIGLNGGPDTTGPPAGDDPEPE